ncbi:MAG: hypothetical protein K2M22_10410, partial [Lachnospiraceae bacterium]|nr:hypothetical protein [Lachnospiraceae bacterium]
AAVGFSVFIAKSGEGSYATMDLSKFAGKTINVKLYLKSESQGSVTLGILEKERQDIVTAQLDTEWTQVIFSHQFSEEECERALFFQGDNADDFYIDDFSITMVEETDRYETQVLKDGEAAEEAATNESVEEDSDTDQGDANNTTQLSDPSSDTNSSVYKTILVCCMIAFLAGIAAFITYMRKKKAGKK